jgi:hypothetical protein
VPPAFRRCFIARNSIGAQDPQPSTISVPFKVLGSAVGSSVAVKARPRSPHSAVAGRSAAANSALMIFPSSEPVVVLAPPLTATTRVLPDCEIEMGAFNTDDRKAPQGEAESAPVPGSIFQAPSTENGADNPLPLFRTPTSPSTGSATRKMYAITKLRFVCEIAVSPSQESALSCWHPVRRQPARRRHDVKPAAGRRPRSDPPAACAMDAFRSAQPSQPSPSSWSELQARPRRTRLLAAI